MFGAAAAAHGLAGCSSIPKHVTPVVPVTSEIYSHVAIVHSDRAVREDGKIDPAVVQEMFDRAILTLTNEDSIEAAWGTILPELKDSDTIGLKINCINSSLPTHPEVVDAIIHHLRQVGVRDNNIIVWDREDSILSGGGGPTDSGYVLNSGDTGVRYLTTGTDNIGYDDSVIARLPSSSLDRPISKIVTRECTYLINVPQLRSHSLAGITQCMKNYYGAIPLFDAFALGSIIDVHDSNCNPAIPELYNQEIFVEKTKLHVSDALLTLYEGGPFGSPQGILGKIMVSTDPVALDTMGLMILEAEKKKRGIESVMRRAKYIQTAAEMGIGTNNPEQMNVHRLRV